MQNMDHNEITNGNRLINELMGSTIKINQDDVKDIPLAFLQLNDLKFHQSWKWLMPVVVKIEDDEGHTVRIEGKTCAVILDDDTIFEAEADSKMEAVWTAVVDFLGA
jgi:hypothetical protein